MPVVRVNTSGNRHLAFRPIIFAFVTDLTSLNTFALPVKAKRLVQLHSIAEAQAFLRAGDQSDGPIMVLGGGSNVLFTKDFEGTIVQLAIKEIKESPHDDRFLDVYAGAGVVWNDLVTYTISQGLGGLENLTLIWGWVGAAPMQNIGAYGAEVKDTIIAVHALEVATGNERTFTNAECRFGYRESIFKHEAKGHYWITGVTFRLDKEPRLKMSYGDIRKTLDEMEVNEPTVADISAAVARIRTAKLPDPHKEGNAGSFFKNPEVHAAQAQALLDKHPLMPSFPAPEGRIKIPAGWLIEQAGWKGYRRGPVGVHPRQALVLVHYGGGQGSDILQLARDIQQDVEAKFGIALQVEVNVV